MNYFQAPSFDALVVACQKDFTTNFESLKSHVEAIAQGSYEQARAIMLDLTRHFPLFAHAKLWKLSRRRPLTRSLFALAYHAGPQEYIAAVYAWLREGPATPSTAAWCCPAIPTWCRRAKARPRSA